ncbi:protocatechuate 4,5-dioxygenase subunit alpha [Azospirillum halopraeferens]|uniref:protocatechuate 4,5-dioxygenase subunit alpha n=1 Tax=Azospirillum halopraeferens TaxID=34010 RepID=UPI001FE1F9BB|nr:protocatechuate 4,5-dioxygenase subunit alpha [Azospirillum halopraeferens]
MPDQLRIACIGFGEAASAFVSGWGAERAAAVTAYDIKTDHPDPAVRAGKLADYERAGIRGCATAAEALEGAALVFSLVTADQAGKVAAAAAPLLARGALFLDGNSCAPGTKRRSAAAVAQAGRGLYVDVAVMAPVYPKRHRTPLLLSGAHAAVAAERLAALDMDVKIAEGEVGTASSIKMIRSVMMKGMEALFAECVLAGRKAGVDAVVLDSLDATFPGFDFRAKAAYNLERVMTHGLRRAAEMREVALTVAELGLPNGMAAATVDWQQRIGAMGLSAAEGEDYAARADRVLEGLGHAPARRQVPPPAYADIPGTYVFDAEQSRRGYHLNMFCMSLRHAANREAFKADEQGYLNRFPLSDEQRRAVLERDWNGMLRLGGNIYYTSKLAATDGINFQQLAARMTGVTEDEYRAMMLAGGRPIDGNRSKKEWGNG